MLKNDHNLSDLEIARELLDSISGGEFNPVLTPGPIRGGCSLYMCAIPLYGVIIDRVFTEL